MTGKDTIDDLEPPFREGNGEAFERKNIVTVNTVIINPIKLKKAAERIKTIMESYNVYLSDKFIEDIAFAVIKSYIQEDKSDT